MGGVSPQQRQSNFELRVREFDALLRSLIDVLRLQLPEEEIKGVYESGEQYDFYRDLSSLIVTATHEIFIVDAYLDEEVFNLYVGKVPGSATVRILSNKIGANVETVARMYAKNRPLELRSSTDVHDRTAVNNYDHCRAPGPVDGLSFGGQAGGVGAHIQRCTG
jgi:hypothetical protein